ncbi:MAG: hypothetical protein JW828_11640, partial [Sedimentisphaerales bacterium]|nr:hypothetical protein [Sedimentisphaerales bacterium]
MNRTHRLFHRTSPLAALLACRFLSAVLGICIALPGCSMVTSTDTDSAMDGPGRVGATDKTRQIEMTNGLQTIRLEELDQLTRAF